MNSYKQKAYGAFALEDRIRMDSSSGGIFTILAQQVLLEGGIVWGAAFDADHNVIYSSAETEQELAFLRGSKYVFLPIKGLAEKVKPMLEEGRKVLITVSPCQAVILRNQLGEYKNLILVDFVCHGAPDTSVWRKYLDETEKAAKGPVDKIYFRRKTGLWTDYRFEMVFPDGSVVSSEPQNHPYMQAFLKNLSLREACTICTAKGENRHSDLTLGDFWGVSKICPQIFEKTGTSLVFINSQIGESLWEQISVNVRREEVSIAEAVKFNPSAIKPSIKDENWTNYQMGLSGHTIAELAQMYCVINKKEKWKNGIRKLISSLRK